MCSRDGGGHQKTSWERLIVKGYLYVIGRGVGGTHVHDRGRGLDDELEVASCVYPLSQISLLFVLLHSTEPSKGISKW